LLALPPTRFDPTDLFVDGVPINVIQAAKSYEDHVAANGQPDSHAKAKEILCGLSFLCQEGYSHHVSYTSAGLAGAFIDREVETKGVRDFFGLMADPVSDFIHIYSSTSSTGRRLSVRVSI